YPNVRKSTLISRISAARPKIADYPFTTLQPNLGVVLVGEAASEVSFVVADIPGLIEGAHQGAGLGTQFLRHIERTRLLVHMVDISDASGRPDPVKDFGVIMAELASFGAGLEQKPMMVVAAKADVANPDKLAKLRKYCDKRRYPFSVISAVTGENVNKLKWEMGAIVRQMRNGSYEGPKGLRTAAPAKAAPKEKRPLAAKQASSAKAKPAIKSRKLAASKPKVAPRKKRVAAKMAERDRATANKAGRRRATAAKPKKKLSSKQRAKGRS